MRPGIAIGVCLTGLLAATAVRGAADPDPVPTAKSTTQAPRWAHEKPARDEPTAAGPRRTSPRLPAARLTRSGYASVQVNVDAEGNNIVGDAANEPCLAIDPTNPDRLVIGWRQFDSVTSDFREAGWAYSHDGGQTWTFPGVLEDGVFRSDPVLDVDADGNFYFYSLKEDLSCDLFKSVDGGVTWPQKVAALGGDKEWMVIDRTGGMGHGNIYGMWSPGCFARSTDGGLTFDGPYVCTHFPSWGTMTIAPNGTVHTAGVDLREWGTPTYVGRSTNAQDPFAVPTLTAQRILLGGVEYGPAVNPGGLLGQVNIASDHSGGPTHGYIYVLASVRFTPDHADVEFIRSTDDGQTWSFPPVRVNDDPTTSAWQWFAALAVAPNGRIDAVWNDTRHDTTSSPVTFSELYYAYSVDGGTTWSVNQPVSPSFNHFLGYPQQQKLGDYYSVVSDDGVANVAYAATFNGEQDIYFLRIGDCNNNGVHDGTDITDGTSLDIDGNGTPDECQDCDGDGVADPQEILDGTHPDCNQNWAPDVCDIADGTSADCNVNGVPDECDLAAGTSPDCNSSAVPDECELGNNDCNANAVPDECDILSGTSVDCNSNGVPDECDLANCDGSVWCADCNSNGIIDACDVDAGTSPDCNSNGAPDECDLSDCDGSAWCADCNGNSIIDSCDVASGWSRDCNRNGVPDECDLSSGASTDANTNGIPDECEQPLFVDDDAPPGGDGRTWTTAYASLSDGLAAAFLGQEVRLGQGTYRPTTRTEESDPRSATFLLRNEVAIRGGYAGLDTPNPDLRDPSVYVSILSGDLGGDDDPNVPSTRSENSYHVVTAATGTDATAVLDGVRVTAGNANGTGAHASGGGAYCAGTPTLMDCSMSGNSASARGGAVSGWGGLAVTGCTFSGNEAARGGGLYFSYGSSELANCTFSGNVAGKSGGGGVYLERGSPTLTACTFCVNLSTGTGNGGGGLCAYYSTPTLTNCTFWGNTAFSSGGGLYRHGYSPRLESCIVWGNVGGQSAGDAAVTCSCVQDGFAGAGNIDLDPLFVDPDGPDDDPETWADNDYHLSPLSPCIDAGDPAFVPAPDATDVDGEPRVQNCRVDMGADESPYFVDCNSNGTGDACDIAAGTSRDCNGNFLPDDCELCGDLDGDGDVDADDYALFRASFGRSAGQTGYNACCDYDNDGVVTFFDYQMWLECRAAPLNRSPGARPAAFGPASTLRDKWLPPLAVVPASVAIPGRGRFLDRDRQAR